MEIPEGFTNVRFLFRCSGVADEMSFAIGFSDTGSPTPLIVASAARIAFEESFLDPISSVHAGWSFLGTSATQTVGGLPVVADSLVTSNGTGSLDNPPPNCATLVRKQTASGGRKNRGRMFMPPFNLGENHVNASGNILEAIRSEFDNRWATCHGKFLAESLEPVLFHSNPADAPTEITGFSVQGLLATQRRRMR